jgi:hypothetical protein
MTGEPDLRRVFTTLLSIGLLGTSAGTVPAAASATKTRDGAGIGEQAQTGDRFGAGLP